MKSRDDVILDVAQVIERRIRDRPTVGTLDRETVEAIDVVHHALNFTKQPRGLQVWREALWERKVSDTARSAVIEMLKYLTDAMERGETEAVSRICDCLNVILIPLLRDEGALNSVKELDERIAVDRV